MNVGNRPGRLVARAAASLTVAVVALALLAGPASASGGSISGQVTSWTTEEPIAGIEVCAITTAILTPEVEKELEEGIEPGIEQLDCTTTTTTGDYTIAGLGAGSFFVAFADPFAGALNYVKQLYNEEEGLEEADPVTVVSGSATTGIDAELLEGGKVSGVVTNASTGAPLQGALVCAYSVSNPREGGCARSGAGGAYTAVGLESGAYAVSAAAAGFSPSYHGGAGTLTAATPVTIAVKQDVGGIDIALHPGPGSAGLPGAGESGAGYTAPGGALGAIRGLSGLRTAPARGVALANALLNRGTGRSVVVRLSCKSTKACRGKVSLTATRHVRRGRGRVAQTVAIGSARFAGGPGQTFSVKVPLTSPGHAMLGAAHGRLAANLRIVQQAPAPAHTTVKQVLLVGKRVAAHGALARSGRA